MGCQGFPLERTWRRIEQRAAIVSRSPLRQPHDHHDHHDHPTDLDLNRTNQLVQIVVACANRKVEAAPPDLRLGTYPPDLRTRSEQWTKRLGSPRSYGIEARNLYQGEHWSVVKQIADQAGHSGYAAEIWIVSAGYGLVPISARLEPYGATFSSGSADSISIGGRRNSNNQLWWDLLASSPNLDFSHPRTLSDLAYRDTSAPMIVALSESYLQAVQHDLIRAVEAKGTRLLLVSTGTPPAGLGEVQLPCDARLLSSLGGSRTSLIARVAKFIIATTSQHALDDTKVRMLLRNELDKSKDLPKYKRQRMTDAEVLAWITGHLASDRPSASSLLRNLRDRGFACEQKRFAGIYEQALVEYQQ